jgi:hypothetical protein
MAMAMAIIQVKKFMDHVVVLPWRMNYGSLRAIGGCG